MRPQDIAILLKIVANDDLNWKLIELSTSLYISVSEISESLNRSQIASLLDSSKKKVNRQSLFEFLEHGICYVFPQKPGALVRGLPTAHSHQLMKDHFKGEEIYVWPDKNGNLIGQQIDPFYPKQVEAAKVDAIFYKLLALVDVIRIGRVREVNLALSELKKMM